MPTIVHMEPPEPAEAGPIRKLGRDFLRGVSRLRIAEKIFGIVALKVLVMTLMVVMSIQSIRLHFEHQRVLASTATAAINIERVNGLIYATIMDSRGIYMTTDNSQIKPYADELLRHNRELAGVVEKWESTVDFVDEGAFPAFRQRIFQFTDFRRELAHKATASGAAAAREFAISHSARALHIALNNDLESFAKILSGRTILVTELGEESRIALWYLALLGFCGLLLTALNVIVVRRSVIAPLSDIAKATDSIAAGKIDIAVPHVARPDEIGHLARAVRNFRDAVGRNFELEELEHGTARQRDAAMGERDKFTDKYHETKWRLSAALNNMAQGLIMIDSKAKILMTNRKFRSMYQLPPEIIGPDTTLKDLLIYRAEKGLFVGDIDKFMATVLERIARGQPSTGELTLADGRIFRVSEQPMAGGGWVATHEDFTEQRRAERILARTERFLATIIENVNEAIVAKEARDLRYIFVNKAAEKLLGLPRAAIIGRSARELFPAETAELIERYDRQLLANNPDFEFAIRTITTPNNGRRTVATRRLSIAGEAGESGVFLSLIEDRTDQTGIADAAA